PGIEMRCFHFISIFQNMRSIRRRIPHWIFSSRISCSFPMILRKVLQSGSRLCLLRTCRIKTQLDQVPIKGLLRPLCLSGGNFNGYFHKNLAIGESPLLCRHFIRKAFVPYFPSKHTDWPEHQKLLEVERALVEVTQELLLVL